MNKSSRRGFLVATGTGVAAAAVTPPQLVAYVQDAKAGTVVIMVGEREVNVTDKDLSARIQSYARS